MSTIKNENTGERMETMCRRRLLNEQINAYSNVIELDPESVAAYYCRGNAYCNDGQYENAIKDYDMLIELDPDNMNAYYCRGVAYYSSGQYIKAINDYSKVIQLKPDFAEAYNNRGIAYSKCGQYKNAMADYDRAIGLKPDFAAAYSNRGLVYGKQNKWHEQIADYKEVLRLGEDRYGRTKSGRLSNDYKRWIKRAQLMILSQDDNKADLDMVKIYVDEAELEITTVNVDSEIKFPDTFMDTSTIVKKEVIAFDDFNKNGNSGENASISAGSGCSSPKNASTAAL